MVRWLVAGLTTVVAFSLATWVSGALILPTVIEDPSVRWGLAGALGVALSALAALWGHAFAQGEHSQGASDGDVAVTCGTATTARPDITSNVIRGGTFHGPVIQARDVSVSAPHIPRTPDS